MPWGWRGRGGGTAHIVATAIVVAGVGLGGRGVLEDLGVSVSFLNHFAGDVREVEWDLCLVLWSRNIFGTLLLGLGVDYCQEATI